MCGVAGIYNPKSWSEIAALGVLKEMTGTLTHRGPDAHGVWADSSGRCFLGHRRLSIIDISDAGRQPMGNTNHRWMIAFNGEIYNYLEIRQELEGMGLSFHGRSDTEVLVEAIAQWGIDALPKLDGMFAFAAFDTLSGELILARDAFGEKPLYYVELSSGGYAFASELQALEKLPNFDPAVSLDAMAEVLMFQYIGAPRTIYSSVKKLPPGSWMRLTLQQPPQIDRFFEFRPGMAGFDRGPLSVLVDELEEILLRSIKRRLISDVPLGAFLSGGVDSSTVCALIRKKLGLPLKTFSMGFRNAPESEHFAAREMAKHIGSDHHEQILTPDIGAFLSDIGRILDEPNGDSSCMPTYLLAQFARQQVTVAVSGDGGDEMFAGYGRYFLTLDEEKRHPPTWNPGHAYYSDRVLVSTEKFIEELFETVPEGLANHLAHLRSELTHEGIPLFCRLRKADVENYLPGAVLSKVDRMSMRHSLEVRTPFLNSDLARFAEKLPLDVLYRDGRGKLLLREVAYRYLPRKLIDAPKQGFGIPMARWGKDALLEAASSLLESEDSKLKTSLGRAAISRFLSRQRSNEGFSAYQVWALVMLESWCRHHPVRLDRIREALGRHRMEPNESGEIDRKILAAWPVGENKYRVIEETRNILSDEVRMESTAQSRLQGVIPLPFWAEELSADESKNRKVPNGAKLVFGDPQLSRKIDRQEIEKYASMGVNEIEYVHPYLPDRFIVRIRFQRKTWIQRIAAAVRLRRMTILELKFNERMRLLRQIAARKLPHGKLFQLGPLAMASGDFDQDMAHRFMLFEGLTQLPPIPTSYVEIEQKGNGRYSVWNGSLYFSPTRLRRILSHSYWLVERSQDTANMMEYTCDLVKRDHLEFASKLKTWIDVHDRGQGPSSLALPESMVVMTHALSPGGAERQWCYLASALKEQGFKVYFVVTNSLDGKDGHYRSLLEKSRIPVIQLPHEPVRGVSAESIVESTISALLGVYNPFDDNLLRLIVLLRRLRARAVFTQLDHPNILGAMAGVLAGVPRIVLSFRNYNPTHFSYLDKDWLRDYYRAVIRSPRVTLTGNSNLANDDYAKWLGIDPKSVTLIPNAIDEVDFGKPTQDELFRLMEQLGIVPGTPIVLGIFRLSEEKQPLLFLDICAELIAAYPGLRVLIVGVGPMQQEVQQYIERLGLVRNVSLLGRRTDVSSLMRISRFLLLTSSREGMPNVLMEAQLLGLPVVATRIGGVPNCVRHGITGFLENVGDVKALTKACLSLLSNPGQAAHMGLAGTAWMRDFFTRSQMARRFVDIAEIETAEATKTSV